MSHGLDPQSARQWLKGHAKAQGIIDRERQAYLSRLGAAEALQLYLELLSHGEEANQDRPSALLTAMREATRNVQDSRSA